LQYKGGGQGLDMGRCIGKFGFRDINETEKPLNTKKAIMD